MMSPPLYTLIRTPCTAPGASRGAVKLIVSRKPSGGHGVPAENRVGVYGKGASIGPVLWPLYWKADALFAGRAYAVWEWLRYAQVEKISSAVLCGADRSQR